MSRTTSQTRAARDENNLVSLQVGVVHETAEVRIHHDSLLQIRPTFGAWQAPVRIHTGDDTAAILAVNFDGIVRRNQLAVSVSHGMRVFRVTDR